MNRGFNYSGYPYMKHLIASLFLLFPIFSAYAQFGVSGGIGSPYEYTTNLSGTGISKVYLLNTLSNGSISYTTNAAVVRFYRYSSSIADKELVPASDITSTNSGDNTTYSIKNIQDSKAYFAEIDGSVTAAIWIIDYSLHLPQINSIEIASGEVCDSVKQLVINKSDDLFFHANNGSQHRVQRLYRIDYNTMVWDDASKQFVEGTKAYENLDIGMDYPVEAPLIDSEFTISGDQFAEHFGMKFNKVSAPYQASTVQARIVAEKLNATEEEQETGSIDGLGGSAPVEVQFYGMANEPVSRYYTWYIYNDTDKDNPIARYTDRDIRFTFKESGTYTVKLEVTDRSSSCQDSTSVKIYTEDFVLKAPNFLLIDGTRVFKPTYQSVFKFKGYIFNRWGNKIYEWNDPSQGWDGTYHGREVTPGAYFYIMTAEDGSGKQHTISGDVNVLRKK
jgi:gliding motility-associated-like protein